MEVNKKQSETPKEESFDIKGFFNSCVSHWRWFAWSVGIFLLIGVAYAYRQQNKYLRSMSVLIKDQGDGMPSIGGSMGAAMSFLSPNTNVYNELISFLSPAVMSEVVDRLDLTMNYTLRGFPRNTTLYGTNLPYLVKFDGVEPEQGASMKMRLNPDGSKELYKFRLYTGSKVLKFDGKVKMPAGALTARTPVGVVQVLPNPRYAGKGFENVETVIVSKGGYSATVQAYTQRLKGDLADRDAEVIDLSLRDTSVERADDILLAVLDVYTARYMEDKNKMALATSKFINERLNMIRNELEGTESELKDYQQSKGIVSLPDQARVAVEAGKEIDRELLDASMRHQMAGYINSYLHNSDNLYKVIPVNSGGTSPQIEKQILEYNETLIQRNNLAESSSISNPLVKELDNKLSVMKEALNNSMATYEHTLGVNVRELEKNKGALQGKLSTLPREEYELRPIIRQQQIKEQLYLYLLQRREENELTKTFSASNTRVITPPTGPVLPVSPKKGLIICIAFLIGLVIPTGAVYALELTNTTVRSRKDLEHMATPFLGEIPFVGRHQKRKWLKKILSFKKKSPRPLETLPAVVSSGSRDLVNESFRIIRGSLDFMARGGDKVFMVTSFNPGSGKSFVGYNLAASFAIKGKKVLVIDCDLRHGSMSQYIGMPSKGLSAYLTGATDNWEGLVVKVAGQSGMSVLPIGNRPPNPAELLESPRMKTLLEEVSADYDYVFLDCPPVDVVVDTQILAPIVDRTIFVVRSGLLEKSSVHSIDELYHSYRFKQMGVLLNGTEASMSRYGNDGRGYYGAEYGSE